MARGSEMVRQRGIAIYRIKLYYSGNGTTKYTTGQSRESFSVFCELYFYWCFRYRDVH